MLKIYGSQTPMLLKVLWTAEELNLNYEHIPVSLSNGDVKSKDHLARHPFGKVPVIEHEGRFLFESNAIIRYLANFSKSDLYPSEVFERAKVDQWLDYFSMQVGRWTTSAWFNKVIGPKFFGEQPDMKTRTDLEKWLSEHMPILNTLMGNSAFLCGNQMTIADINACTLMCSWKDAELDFAKYSNFITWFDKMKARPKLLKLKEHHPTENM